jgi:hypothetical protein
MINGYSLVECSSNLYSCNFPDRLSQGYNPDHEGTRTATKSHQILTNVQSNHVAFPFKLGLAAKIKQQPDVHLGGLHLIDYLTYVPASKSRAGLYFNDYLSETDKVSSVFFSKLLSFVLKL